jgi:ectoine hydroxylase-related dioxygenase (phytanoyl-CoA dioxygenase family)
LYFDKPPGQSWSLSLHRDRTIAVAEHHQPPAPFAKPTVKAGVPHVEASQQLLQRMLTLRLHLDPMNDQNGPLVVIPGSHTNSSDRPEDGEITTIHCNAGDVFVMRPLLSHGSRAAQPNTTLHRRVLHLELAADAQLPPPYRWHHFEPIEASQSA